MKTTFTFARSSAVALLTVTSIMLSSCEKRFDGTNEESAKASMECMAASLSDEEKKEILEDFEEKFGGATNGGRIMASWNHNKESAAEVVQFKMEDFGERYKALSEHSRTQIFTSFRAIPLLFGLISEANTGFSTEEFEQSFKLYNRTQIQPIQRLICDAYDKIYGQKGVLTIKPFSMVGDSEDNVN